MGNTGLARIRLILWGLVVIVGIAATVLYLVRPPERPLGLFGGNFALEATTGGTFTQADLKGTPSLIFFGYTYCPDVCPTTLAESTGWRQALGLTPDDLRIIFVTVDPERDTLEALQSYLSGFGEPVIGLTGTETQVEEAKKAFGVFSEKVEDDSSTEYLVSHTASLFMIDADGRFDGTIAYGEATATALDKVRKLTNL